MLMRPDAEYEIRIYGNGVLQDQGHAYASNACEALEILLDQTGLCAPSESFALVRNTVNNVVFRFELALAT